MKLLRCSSKDQVLNLHPARLSPPSQPDGRPSLEKAAEMDRIAREKGFHRFEWVHRKVDGEDFPVQVTLNAVTIDGRPGMIVVWHDLTDLKRTEERLRLANEKMKKDLEAAAAVQKSMLPVASPLVRGLQVSWLFKPCDEVGGDILNIFPLDETHTGLYVLDVMGHGLPASLLSVSTSHFLSPYSEASFVRDGRGQNKLAMARPAQVADKLNRHFASNPDFVQLFTLLYGVLDARSREFCYVCAGHPLPIVVSTNGTARMIEGSGYPIGVEQAAEYAEICLKLKPGDRLYLYSDGLTEAKNPAGELFGEERLMRILSGARKEPLADSLETVGQKVVSWCGPQGPDDDLTVLACELCCKTEGKA